MTSRTWLLSGVPRSGTSLCCRLAGELPDTVALSEPIRRKEYGGMETPAGASARIGEFAEQARERILAERRASSIQVMGRLDDNRTASAHTAAGLRRLSSGWGEIAIDKPLSARFTLLIKHNALFAALLPRLAGSFGCLALVRNPLSALASWQTVDLPVHRGRIPAGEELDQRLSFALDEEPDVLRRQIIVLDWFFARYRAHLPPENIIRYEDLIETGGLAILAWGDNRHDPPERVWRMLGDVDVVLLPVDDSRHVMGFDHVASIIATLRPRVVVPHHYYIMDVTLRQSTLQPAEEWLRSQGAAVRRLDGPACSYSREELDSLPDRRVDFFGPHVAFDRDAWHAART